MRAGAVVKKAPAVPTTARMAVGFSGEVTQPPWACSGRAVAKRARPINKMEDFFIGGSPFREGTGKTPVSQRTKDVCSFIPFRELGIVSIVAIAGMNHRSNSRGGIAFSPLQFSSAAIGLSSRLARSRPQLFEETFDGGRGVETTGGGESR